MIPTSPTSPVSWTAAAAPAVALVPAVMAVAPAAAAARDAQAGLEQRRGQPRAAAGKGQGVPDPVTQVADEQARTERAREQAERLREMEQSRRETVEELRQALRKAWDASAAVVEQALARDAESRSAAQTARAIDAYGGSGDAADKPPGISRRV